MIPINNRCLKQQEDPRSKTIKQSDMRMSQMSMPDYCPHLHTSTIENLMESYIKNQFDIHDSHNYIGVPADEYYYDTIKNNWFYNNQSCYEDFYNLRIKREQQDEQWSPQIKDEQSQSINQQGFQACEIPKQQQLEYMSRCPFQDPNKFLGPCISSSKEQKNYQRKLKVQAYLRKKSMRSFQKKIIYKCRKQVADNRIRFRGRFISLHQASSILGLDQKSNHNPGELMQKLKNANNLDRPKEQKQVKQFKQIKQKQKVKSKLKPKPVSYTPLIHEVKNTLNKIEEES